MLKQKENTSPLAYEQAREIRAPGLDELTLHAYFADGSAPRYPAIGTPPRPQPLKCAP